MKPPSTKVPSGGGRPGPASPFVPAASPTASTSHTTSGSPRYPWSVTRLYSTPSSLNAVLKWLLRKNTTSSRSLTRSSADAKPPRVSCDADEAKKSSSAYLSARTSARWADPRDDSRRDDSHSSSYSATAFAARDTNSETIDATTSSSSSFPPAFAPASSSDSRIARRTISSSLGLRFIRGDASGRVEASRPPSPASNEGTSTECESLSDVFASASSAAHVSSMTRSISWLYPRAPMAAAASGWCAGSATHAWHRVTSSRSNIASSAVNSKSSA